MPRYFFDLQDRKRCTDYYGSVFNNDAAAIQEARLRALSRTTHELGAYSKSEMIIVRNEQGNEIHRVKIRDDFPSH